MDDNSQLAAGANQGGYQDYSDSRVAPGSTDLTPQFLDVMCEVVAFISDTVEGSIRAEGSPHPKSLVRRLIGRLRPGLPEAQGATKHAPLGPEQLRRARQLALDRARQLNLSEEQASQLADAVMG